MLMTVIWLYLAGWTTLISGHFSPFEMAMTLVVGAACAIGLRLDARSFAAVPATTAVGICIRHRGPRRKRSVFGSVCFRESREGSSFPASCDRRIA